jgi:hypothetical protein
MRSFIVLILFASISNLVFGQESKTLSPLLSFNLHEDLKESSGLIFWDGDLWTHNDSQDPTLFRLNPENGEIKERILLEGVVNTDWEDITQDEAYIYIGDIGNNSGNRKDLHILRISKSGLKKGRPLIDSPEIKHSELDSSQIDILSFRFADQEDFSSKPHANDFDCEAMIVQGGKIFLFTKEWISAGTTVYTLPTEPGQHVAQKISSYPVEGLITGADLSADRNTLVLCGYNALIQPFFCLFRDLSGKGIEDGDLFGESYEKIRLALPYHQVEGVAIKNSGEIYISNEYLKLGNLIQVPQQMHMMRID